MKDIPFPNKNTDLFKIKDVGHNIACIQDFSFDTYAMGYLESCKIILEKMENDILFLSDINVYPAVFLFRHYVELKLKQIILMGEKNKDSHVSLEELSKRYGHDIVKLWNDAKIIINTYWKTGGDKEIKIVEKNIKKLQHKFSDNKGMVFRFPIDTNGNLSFKKDIHIDLKQFKKSIDEIGTFLDGCCDSMIEEENISREMKAEYSDELNY